MSDVVIRVEHLGKKFLIQHQHKKSSDTLRDSLSDGLSALRRSLSRKGSEDRDDVEEFWAVRDISLELNRGDVLGIVGRNGAGKSTFLKLLSRITPPTKGRIELHGRISTLLEVGTGFHPELTGRENIFLNGAILGMPKAEIQRNFDSIVAFSEVERFLDTPVKRYSSGMHMRLAFAVAAHLEPDILLVDEVLAVGDSAFQRKCIGKLRDVSTQEGRTVVFISHNMQSVQSLCTKAAHFERGRLIDIGDVGSVIPRYLAQMSSNQSERTWTMAEAPGNHEVRLQSIRVFSEESMGGVYSSSQDVLVEMQFHASSIPRSLQVGFDIVTDDGMTVLRSFQTDLSEADWPRAVIGENRWLCRIPRALLNAGMYYLAPRIAVHNLYWIVQLDGVVSFEISLDHGSSPLWNDLDASRRPGVMSPILPWKIMASLEIAAAR